MTAPTGKVAETLGRFMAAEHGATDHGGWGTKAGRIAGLRVMLASGMAWHVAVGYADMRCPGLTQNHIPHEGPVRFRPGWGIHSLILN